MVLKNMSMMTQSDINSRKLTEIFHRRIHLSHSYDVGNSSFGSNDTTQSIGVFFTKLFEKDQTKFVEQLVFAALLDNNSQS